MIHVAEIQHAVAKHYGLTMADLRGPGRKRVFIAPRHVAMYLARRMTPQSFRQIGSRFGGRDHTTVLSACQKIKRLRASDPQLSEDISAIVRMIP